MPYNGSSRASRQLGPKRCGEIHTLIVDGGRVVSKRTDRTKTKQGDVELPCVGVLRMREGRITVWRDYFDLATYMNAMKE